MADANVPVMQPIMNMGQMTSVEFPYIWANKDLGGVYRREGRILAGLDKTLYADLYAKAGIEDEEEPTEPEVPPEEPEGGA